MDQAETLSSELMTRAITELLASTHGKEFLWQVISLQPRNAVNFDPSVNMYISGIREATSRVETLLLNADPTALMQLYAYAHERYLGTKDDEDEHDPEF